MMIETFVMPSVSGRYKLDGDTSLQLDIGGRWTSSATTTRPQTPNEFFLTAGVSHSF